MCKKERKSKEVARMLATSGQQNRKAKCQKASKWECNKGSNQIPKMLANMQVTKEASKLLESTEVGKPASKQIQRAHVNIARAKESTQGNCKQYLRLRNKKANSQNATSKQVRKQ